MTYDYGFRIYDPRIIRFLSVDPLAKSYPWYTPYQFAGNTPIAAIDLDGLETFMMTHFKTKDGTRKAKLTLIDADQSKLSVTHRYKDGSTETLTNTEGATNPFRDTRVFEIVTKHSNIEDGNISYDGSQLYGYDDNVRNAEMGIEEDDEGNLTFPNNSVDLVLTPKYTPESFEQGSETQISSNDSRPILVQEIVNAQNPTSFNISAKDQNFATQLQNTITQNHPGVQFNTTIDPNAKESVSHQTLRTEGTQTDTSDDTVNDTRPR